MYRKCYTHSNLMCYVRFELFGANLYLVNQMVPVLEFSQSEGTALNGRFRKNYSLLLWVSYFYSLVAVTFLTLSLARYRLVFASA